MKTLIFGMFVGLAACSVPQSEPIAIEEPSLATSPALASPAIAPRCTTDEVIARDGIGGTGCR